MDDTNRTEGSPNMTRKTLPNRWAGLTAAVAVGSCVLIAVGCANPTPSRLNAPPQGQAHDAHRLQETYVPMVDNALLADMTMSSVHFVPQTAELNALGVRRLMRCASILKVYGLTVRYDGSERDQELRQKRLGQIEAFLVASGLEPDQFAVEHGLAGGEGMTTIEAVAIRQATHGPGDIEITSESSFGAGSD